MDPVAGLLIRLIVLALWTDDLIHSSRVWRSRRDARSLRNLIKSAVIWVGMVSLSIAASGRASGTDVSTAAYFVNYVLSGFLIVGGIFAVVSWRTDREMQG